MGDILRGILGNIKLAFFLAFKSIYKGNRWAVVLIVFVVALSFTDSILTPSIISGITETLNSQQIDTLYGNILIDPPSEDYYLENASQIQQKIEQYPGVTGAAIHLNSSALIEYNWQSKANASYKGDSGTWPVIGIDPESEKKVTTISQTLISGSYLSQNDTNQIVLGVEIAGGAEATTASFLNLGGVQVGDKVRLTYPNGVQREYTIKGIFRARDAEADSQAFVSYKEMTSVMGGSVFENRASQILVKINETGQEDQFIKAFQSMGIDGQVWSWKVYGGSSGSIASSFDVIASLISAIGLVVAAIVMFIIIYINVVNKKKQIGILRAIGINRIAIYISYLCQSLFYAVLGIIIGGMLFGYVIEPYFSAHPLDLSIGLVTLMTSTTTITYAVIGIILAAIFAGIIPVINVTRQSIIKAIWGS